MEITLKHESSTINQSRKRPSKWYKSWKFVTGSLFILLALIFGLVSIYQATHFNTNITINHIEVGGQTKDEALVRLQSSLLTNDIYIGNEKILDGKETKMQFTDSDLANLKDLLKSQKTVFPSFKKKNYTLYPGKEDPYRTVTMKAELKQKLITMNYSLSPPKDAQAILNQGKITIVKSTNGTQYDVPALLKEYDKQEYTSEIHMKSMYIQPIREDSLVIKNEEKKLQEFLNHTVDYKVQDQVYTLKANELIQNAIVTKDMQVSINPDTLQNKITEINHSRSTLGKDFTFKTHSGPLVSVKGQGYGWALDIESETSLVQEAFEKGEKSITAANVHGNGWNKEGYGYEAITNNGIGDTYAEVSIKEQRIWLYKEGKLVLTSNVVTGKQSTNQDTLKGVWYILYKRTPYTLTGSTAGNPNYEIDVDYWAPFTNSGQGFHDASWRSNWRSNAYLTAGSGGCVNVPPNVMRAVYNNLSVYEPVVIY
ncbi:L,D-transpeptidase family protein [Bacillus suaedaesalsae]|uniref:L,D-transpeptidase family protein n=1 Tax=Bacillus suaedaesalsae TaxID=2810349 RepID=A0ABS2DEK9_9BACI|nr:L,D-transpeptidase family protein [Bacillus suaedaesalsae]MBM6616899.1 L,D-transpeptidase family protein [Bacillus suaedaesalsae]